MLICEIQYEMASDFGHQQSGIGNCLALS